MNKTTKLITFLFNLLGWCFIVPLSYLVPKKKNRIVIMGNRKGYFLDNVKYFFLYLDEIEKHPDFYFITANKKTYAELSEHYDNILYYPSVKAFLKIFRSKVYIADSAWWMDNCRLHLSWNAKIVQLWHGIGFKKLHRSNKFFIDETCSWRRRFMLHFIGKLPTYDSFVSTSPFFTDHFFRPSFLSEHFIETGYPRNDVIVNPDKYKFSYLNSDTTTINKIIEMRKNGLRSVLYAPTLRDTGGEGISDGILDLENLNQFALKNDLVFVFKLHPLPQYQTISDHFERIIWYDNVKDVYPFLPYVDAMISDYSSIYLDYILLNRPILFLLYDREKYETKDRELHSFFDDFIVGPVAVNQNQLEENLLNTFKSNDQFKQKREEIIKKSYRYIDDKGAERVYEFIQEKYFKS